MGHPVYITILYLFLKELYIYISFKNKYNIEYMETKFFYIP